MPNRLIRESALTSRSLDKLSDGAERLFWRMTVTTDDAGRFDADPRVVLARCFPLRIESLKPTTIAKWLRELEAADIIRLYTIDGRSYGYFPSWGKHQRIYGLKSKFPDPPADCGNSPQGPADSRSYSYSDIESIHDTGEGLSPDDIQKQWNEIPGVKPCKALGSTIRDRIRSRVTEHPEPAWWTTLFERIQASDFLCGRTNGKEGPFRASLDWALGPKNLDKILAGNYDSAPVGATGSSTCTKQVQRGNFLKPCGNPATPSSRPDEPRCVDHLAGVAERNGHAVH